MSTNQSLETGLGALTAGSSGWGVGVEDLDNDGWKIEGSACDASHVLDNVEAIDRSLHYLETPLLALNHNGRFETRGIWNYNSSGGSRTGIWRSEQ